MNPYALTIAQAKQLLTKKEASAEELVRSCMERIEAVDDSVNAVVHRNFDGALAQAKKVDSHPEEFGELAGIPYLAKDVFCEKGVPTTACSPILQNPTYTPPYSSTVTRLLEASGAISLGKVNTDEFTMGASTETSAYGPTHNPWDVSRVAGGSSGGSAAAVAADECLFALGTDTGGSIRQPAGFCNVAGIRPTYGRVSRFGVMSMASSLDTIGPLCKTVEDTAIVLEAIAGKDPQDATTIDRPVPRYTEALQKGIKGLRIGVPREYFAEGLHADVESSVREAIRTLEKEGALIEEISLPLTKYAIATYYVICPCEVSSNMARYDGIRFGLHSEASDSLHSQYVQTRSRGFGTEVQRRILIGTYALSAGYYDAYYRKALQVRALIVREFTEAFEKVDAIVGPVSPTPAFKVGAHEGDPVAMYLEDAFLTAQPMAGIPCMSIPCGMSTDGLPIGLQIMAPQWHEETVLQTAYAFERVTDWHTKKPML